MEDVGAAYDGVVAMVWDARWEMPDEDDWFYDADNNDKDLVYDVVVRILSALPDIRWS